MWGDDLMSLNVFDQAARYCIRMDPLGFLRWLVLGLDPGLCFRGWLDTRTVPFPGARDRTCDTVAELASGEGGDSDPRWAIVIEFQTEPEPEILERLLEYSILIRRGVRFGPRQRERYQVIAALVSLTGPSQPATLEMTLPGQDSPALRFQAAIRTLREEDANDTLEQIEAGTTSRCLLCWISLMRGGGKSGIIERWKTVASQEPDRLQRATYGAIAIVFAELTDCVEQWKSGLEGWDMRESTVVAEWKAEGRAEGIAQGVAQGMTQARRSDLLLVLKQKFATSVPSDLASMIEAQTDAEVLSRWLMVAVSSESFDAFRSAIAD
jgi:hypothetical protein